MLYEAIMSVDPEPRSYWKKPHLPTKHLSFQTALCLLTMLRLTLLPLERVCSHTLPHELACLPLAAVKVPGNEIMFTKKDLGSRCTPPAFTTLGRLSLNPS